MKKNLKSLDLFILTLIVVTQFINCTYSSIDMNDKVNQSINQLLQTDKINDLTEETPQMPNNMSNELKFMQNLILKSYGIAYQKHYPRFTQLESEDYSLNNVLDKFELKRKRDKTNRVPYTVNRQHWHDEYNVWIADAVSNSVLKVYKILKGWHHYSANNAIRDSKSYWCSKLIKKKKKIVYWEARLNKVTRIHAINMVWAYAPAKYQIESSLDGIKYKTVIPWRKSVENGNKGWWKRLFSHLRGRYKSFADRITFDKPIFAKYFRILMRGPVNIYFGLYKVNLLARNWVVMIKNKPKGKCEESCWTINTLKPVHGSLVQYGECIPQIALTENRELFILHPEGMIYHYPSGLCVTTSHDKKLRLEDCWLALNQNDGRSIFHFQEDKSVVSEFDMSNCVTVSSSPNTINLAKTASKVEVTSEVATGGHLGNRAIDGNSNTYWASHPGEEMVVFTMYFNDYITANRIIIKWKYYAKDYDILTLSLERGWKHIYKIRGNAKKETTHDLKFSNIRAVQIKMTKNGESYMNLPIYGITDINIDDGTMNLVSKECDKIKSKSEKTWIIDQQWYYINTNKKPWMDVWNKLTQTYLKLRSLSRKIHLNWKMTKTGKVKSTFLRELMKKKKEEMAKVLEKMKIYRSVDLPSIVHPKFIDIIEKFRIENYFEKRLADQKASYGATISTPASDCYMIKKLIPSKKSGFYWIKTRCSKKPYRLFCDFSVEGKGVSILIYNDNQNPNSQMEGSKLETIKDIRYQCAKTGLEPIQINNNLMMRRIFYLLKVYGWDLARPLVIPLGYDYQCDKYSCSNEYQSLNSEDSNSIQRFFDVPTNFYDQIGGSVSEKGKAVGFGYSGKGKPKFFNLNDSKITALVCSTNNYGLAGTATSVEITCEDNIIDNPSLNAGINNSIKVNCPSFCASSNANIYGTGKYSERSSVCKAGIHAGIIKDLEGGIFIINISGSKTNFKGGKANGIVSKDLIGKSTTTFSISANDDKCPIDFNKDPNQKPQGSSYLEMDESEAQIGNLLNSASQLGNAVGNAVNVGLGSGINAVNNRVNSASNALNNKVNAINNGINTVGNAVNNAVNNGVNAVNNGINAVGNAVNNGVNTLDSGIKWGINKVNSGINNAVNNVAQTVNNLFNTGEKKKKKKKFEEPCKNSSEKGIKKVKDIRNADYNEFKEYQKFGKYLQFLTNKFMEQYAWAKNPSPLSLPVLKGTYLKLRNFIKNLQRLAELLISKSTERLEYTKNVYKLLSHTLQKLGKHKEYLVDYNNLNEYWMVFDSFKSKNYPSNWITTTSQLQGKSQAIFQTKPITSASIASFYVLKYKKYFDFKLNLDLMTRNNLSLGVVWRFKNPFNFYALEISQKLGIKRVLRVVNGKYTVLDNIKDGGIFQNQWFKAQITMIKQTVIIRFGESSKYGEYDNLPVIFNIDDFDHREGSVGLMVNGNNEYYVDGFHVKPLSCWNAWQPRSDIEVITDRANVYDEMYIGDPSKRYRQEDPVGMINGPSEWSFKNDVLDRETVITQKTEVADKSEYKEPSMFILEKKYIKLGWISVHFAANKDGIIGIVFKYRDRNNYYLLEIGGGKPENRFFQLRKKIQGMMKVVSRINTFDELPLEERNKSDAFGYIPLKWYYIRIVVEESGFKVFFSKIGYGEKMIFQINDNEIQIGNIGLTTYATPASFDNLMLRPKVEDIQLNFNTDDIPASVNPDDDAFFYDLNNSEEESTTSKDKNKKVHKKREAIPWKICLRNRSQEQRSNYCKDNFKNLLNLKKKCEQNYCNFCCEKNVPWVHRTHLYSCKKTCKMLATKTKGPSADHKWKTLCINVAKPAFSIYAYCDDTFEGIVNISRCKLDTCRLCCVSTDEVRNTDLAINSLDKCFEACSTTFIPAPKDIE